MDFSRRCSSAFARAMAFTNYDRAIGVHRDPHSGDVDGEECSAVFTGEHATGFNGPPPAVEPEDPIGYRDRVPAFNIREFASVGLTSADNLPALGGTVLQAGRPVLHLHNPALERCCQGFIRKRRAGDGRHDFMQVGEPRNGIGEGLLVEVGFWGADAVVD